MPTHSELLEAKGHLIDSNILPAIFDKVIEQGSTYEVLRFDIGRTNEEPSLLRLRIDSPDETTLRDLIDELIPLGCELVRQADVQTLPAEKDGCVPEEFYSTTNHRTQVRISGRWVEVEKQRMDAVIVIENGRPRCQKLREVRRGMSIVVGHEGLRVLPEFKPRDRDGFAFMANDISSERRVEVSVARVAELMREARRSGGRIAVVAGPVIVHTGGIPYFSQLVRMGFVDVLLSGNALAVHDVEYAFFGTSLGVDLEKGSPVEEGHKNHMRAINRIARAGGLRPAVDQGVLKSGVMHECVTHGVDFVLAGSIRDDGPLPDTIMDLVEAQDRYAKALEGVKVVLMLSTMLHSIGVGNMLPAWVRVVCVDINPAVVTKLADRGSTQTVGIVTDVGLFLSTLARKLAEDAQPR